MTDHAAFTEQVRALVAEGDRVPTQRAKFKIEEGQRIWLPDFDGGTYLVVDDVEPNGDALTLTVRAVGE